MKNDEGNGLTLAPTLPNYRKMFSDRKESASFAQIPAALAASIGVSTAEISQQLAVPASFSRPLAKEEL
jgi:hypothetical protein